MPTTTELRDPELDAAAERFWAKVDRRSRDECWPWTGATNVNGYGRFYVGGGRENRRTEYAHRVAYELTFGPIPEEDDEGNPITVDHLCCDPGCANPYDLELVTRRENILRGTSPAAFNAAKQRCPAGHPYDDENTYVAPSTGSRHCRTCRRRRDRERRRP